MVFGNPTKVSIIEPERSAGWSPFVSKAHLRTSAASLACLNVSVPRCIKTHALAWTPALVPFVLPDSQLDKSLSDTAIGHVESIKSITLKISVGFEIDS